MSSNAWGTVRSNLLVNSFSSFIDNLLFILLEFPSITYFMSDYSLHYWLFADTKYWIPVLCHLKFNCILLYGRLLVLIFIHVFHSFLCFSVNYFLFQVCSWGGYTFIINLIPMHVLLCIVTGRYSSRLYIAYAPLVSICITQEVWILLNKQQEYVFQYAIEK